jgi:hypothetical protein
MRNCGKLPVWLWSALGLNLGAAVLFADNPGHLYASIAGSNVFRLRPPVAQTVIPQPAPLLKVTPVGITTILGDKRVLLKIRFPAQPPEPAREVACILAVGQREGPVEVLDIDESAGSVRIRNSGTEKVLTLASDGPRLPSTRPPGELPPLPPDPLPRQR